MRKQGDESIAVNVPAPLVARLKQKAAADDRSLASYVRLILRREAEQVAA